MGVKQAFTNLISMAFDFHCVIIINLMSFFHCLAKERGWVGGKEMMMSCTTNIKLYINLII